MFNNTIVSRSERRNLSSKARRELRKWWTEYCEIIEDRDEDVDASLETTQMVLLFAVQDALHPPQRIGIPAQNRQLRALCSATDSLDEYTKEVLAVELAKRIGDQLFECPSHPRRNAEVLVTLINEMIKATTDTSWIQHHKHNIQTDRAFILISELLIHCDKFLVFDNVESSSTRESAFHKLVLIGLREIGDNRVCAEDLIQQVKQNTLSKRKKQHQTV